MARSIIFALLFLGGSLQAQLFFDLGVKGGFGGNLMINSNVFDDADLTPKFSPAFTGGAKLGLNFTMDHALAVEVMYSGAKQNYDYVVLNDVGSENTRTKSLDWSSIDFLVLYRKTGAGQYVEIGGQYASLNKANFTDTENDISNLDLLNQVEKGRIAGVLGFGSNIAGGGLSMISIGLRVKYDITDFFMLESAADTVYGKVYTSYKPTSPLTALLVLEINQGIGYFAKRSCPKRVKYFNYD